MPSELSLYIKKAFNEWLHLIESQEDLAFKSDADLAKALNVSRFTIQRAKTLLSAKGIIILKGNKKLPGRKVIKKDFFKLGASSEKKSTLLIKQILIDLGEGFYKADQAINETELAKKYDCHVNVIREVLISVQNYGLVVKNGRSQWRVLPINEESVREVAALREALELHALQKMLERSKQDPLRIKFESLLEPHEQMLNKNNENLLEDLMELDKEFHHSLIEACDNKFFNQYKMLISYFIYNTLRARKMDGKNFSGLIQHINVLKYCISNQKLRCISEMKKHIEFSGKVLTELGHYI